MKFDVYLNEESFETFTKFDILKRRKYWRNPAIFAIILCTSAITCFCFPKKDSAVTLGIVMLLIGLGVPAVYIGTFFSNMKKQGKAQHLDEGRLAYTIELTEKEKGIEISNGYEHMKYAWKDAYHAYRNRKCIYLYITDRKAFLIPDFKKEESTENVWSIITSKMGPDRCTVLNQ